MRWHPPLMVFAALMVLLAVVSLMGLMVDPRTVVGDPIWLKPLKFAISFGLYAVTLAWLLSLLPRARRWGFWLGTVIAVAGVAEHVLIVVQVVRGRQSHFNIATPFDESLYNAMAAMIGIVWVANLVLAGFAAFQRLSDRVTAWAIRLGMLISLAGVAVTAYLLVTNKTPEQRAQDKLGLLETVGAHSIGVPDGGPGMPLVGWSTLGGDLRVGHFLSIHALQALPLLALALAALGLRFARLRAERVRLRLVLVAAGACSAAIALTTWQALRAQPLFQPDFTTLTVAAAVLAITVIATTVVLLAEHPGGDGEGGVGSRDAAVDRRL